MIIVSTDRPVIARTLSDLNHAVIADDEHTGDAVAFHAGSTIDESDRTGLTISLDLFDVAVPARLGAHLGRAHVVTATADAVERLYPGMPSLAVAASWREYGVGCGIIVSHRDGVLLMAPNGLTYRRFTPGAAVVGDTYVAGLLDGLAAFGALGTDPALRLADLGSQDWLGVLERAETVARSYGREAVLALVR
jgi:hypothetical protein